MDYKKTASSLLSGRFESLEEDILNIIENADFSSFEGFKQYWKLHGLSMIHHSVRPKEQKQEFYLTLYQILTEIMRVSLELAQKSLFILFTVFFTQHRSQVLIPVCPKTAKVLKELADTQQECRNLIGKLAQSSAFDFCVEEGVKSFTRPKKSHKGGSEKKFDMDLLGKISSLISVDLESLHKQSIKYMCLKEKTKEKITENIQLFQREDFAKNEFSQNFVAANTQVLDLADPTFALSLSSGLSLIETYTSKLLSKAPN